MRKSWIYALWIMILIFWSFTYGKDYEYKNLDIQADIKIDGTIDVKETFVSNFLEERHWIIRLIPLNYSIEWNKFHIDISNINVEWSKFITSKNYWNLEIKIWDENRTLIWDQIYPISYSAYWLIRNFAEMWYNELYWNLIGNDFDTNINSVRAELYLPKNYTGFTSDDFLITIDWTTSTTKDFGGTIDWSKWNKILIEYNQTIYPWDWITLAVKFPSDYFEFDHDKQANLVWNISKSRSTRSDSDTKHLLFIIWFSAFLLWIMYISQNFLNRKIKPIKIWNNFKSKYPVIVQYNPPKWMNSAEAWLLFNCRVDPIDMTSLLYQRANKNLLSISYEKESPTSNKIKSVTLSKKNDISESCPYYERELFNEMFKLGRRSKYIDKNTDLGRIISIEWLEGFWLHKHWVHKNKILSFWKIILTILLIVLLVLWFYYFKWLGILFLIFFIPLFFGLIFKCDDQIKLTDEWEKQAAHVIWYAKFIKECDENKLKLFLEKDPLFVDKTLPYAVAFWLETEFLNKVTPLMKDLEKKRLNVYDSPSWALDILSFMKHILSDQKIKKDFFRTWMRTLRWWWKYNESYWESYGRKIDYTKLWWFKSWSIFSWWWKLFRKWWWGGGWGSKSW